MTQKGRKGFIIETGRPPLYMKASPDVTYKTHTTETRASVSTKQLYCLGLFIC